MIGRKDKPAKRCKIKGFLEFPILRVPNPPPTRSLKMDVELRCSLGKSEQIFANLPTNRAVANLSFSNCCKLKLTTLSFPQKSSHSGQPGTFAIGPLSDQQKGFLDKQVRGHQVGHNFIGKRKAILRKHLGHKLIPGRTRGFRIKTYW